MTPRNPLDFSRWPLCFCVFETPILCAQNDSKLCQDRIKEEFKLFVKYKNNTLAQNTRERIIT